MHALWQCTTQADNVVVAIAICGTSLRPRAVSVHRFLLRLLRRRVGLLVQHYLLKLPRWDRSVLGKKCLQTIFPQRFAIARCYFPAVCLLAPCWPRWNVDILLCWPRWCVCVATREWACGSTIRPLDARMFNVERQTLCTAKNSALSELPWRLSPALASSPHTKTV